MNINASNPCQPIKELCEQLKMVSKVCDQMTGYDRANENAMPGERLKRAYEEYAEGSSIEDTEKAKKFIDGLSERIFSLANEEVENCLIPDEAKRRLQRQLKATERRYNRENEQSCEMALETLRQVKNRLLFAELTKRPPNTITLTDKEVEKKLIELQNEQAEKQMELLLRELPKQSTKRKKRKNNNSRPLAKREIKKTELVPASEKQVKCITECWKKHVPSILQTSRSQMKEHSRVTRRWEKLDTDAIKAFDNGRYHGMTESEISRQRERHYLPGLERILACDETKKLYSFETSNKNIGILSELTYSDKTVETGIIYLGFGKSDKDLLIHRYFEPFTQFASANKVFEGPRVEDSKDQTEENWECSVRYQFQDLDEKGAILLKFTNNGHSLKIFPTRQEEVNRLLNT
ncbi:MAG: hypothetical protein H7A37_00735 [Chlamydiales bacterium]|nr:hypothetical protein [Chlamydiales bacterium]